MSKKWLSLIGALVICLTISGCATTPQEVKPNAAELDSVSSWTTSIANKVADNLKNQLHLTPAQIFTEATTVKNSFPDGDAGVVTQTLRGSMISFTLNKTSISKFLYLDSSMKIHSTKLVASDTPQPIVGCFAASLKNDRFFLNITSQSGLDVKGSIALNNSQKDSSYGDFTGTFDGTTLTGTYTFMSEGLQSKRELFFKAVASGLLAGFGPTEEVGDTSKFTRPLSISWDQSYSYMAQATCTK